MDSPPADMPAKRPKVLRRSARQAARRARLQAESNLQEQDVAYVPKDAAFWRPSSRAASNTHTPTNTTPDHANAAPSASSSFSAPNITTFDIEERLRAIRAGRRKRAGNDSEMHSDDEDLTPRVGRGLPMRHVEVINHQRDAHDDFKYIDRPQYHQSGGAHRLYRHSEYNEKEIHKLYMLECTAMPRTAKMIHDSIVRLLQGRMHCVLDFAQDEDGKFRHYYFFCSCTTAQVNRISKRELPVYREKIKHLCTELGRLGNPYRESSHHIMAWRASWSLAGVDTWCEAAYAPPYNRWREPKARSFKLNPRFEYAYAESIWLAVAHMLVSGTEDIIVVYEGRASGTVVHLNRRQLNRASAAFDSDLLKGHGDPRPGTLDSNQIEFWLSTITRALQPLCEHGPPVVRVSERLIKEVFGYTDVTLEPTTVQDSRVALRWPDLEGDEVVLADERRIRLERQDAREAITTLPRSHQEWRALHYANQRILLED
ncbi:hypothetical protein PTSG_04792 [Salpingoeca rosetta]|uniref:Uncharacterized protein n=1 Tax=Salpingoeca rosetta (strain ATCC 50818 / BSB-021) TaxID=946362 RepID=F2U9Q0_SALR5|nr:uncharacterized protein PTSG_04792 [Salpingoeca rosetta]EGD73077.1 hypothetical protein PTSG_04792 [Salpingoeca rosetta]|eukprot:XP_004994108.1 hypothetical protein PTSG_04792 [Salpingoeca rosetta]